MEMVSLEWILHEWRRRASLKISRSRLCLPTSSTDAPANIVNRTEERLWPGHPISPAPMALAGEVQSRHLGGVVEWKTLLATTQQALLYDSPLFYPERG